MTNARARSARAEHAAVIPIQPFTGLINVARERGWRVREMFRGFEFDRDDIPAPGQYVSYVTAREIMLRAQHAGGTDVAVVSATRKSVTNLGVMALGVMSQRALGDALGFGLQFQRLAGSMLDLRLETEGDEVAVVANDLFDDDESRAFLQVDHLVTLANTLQPLSRGPLAGLRFELEDCVPGAIAARIARQWHCQVRCGTERSRLVFDTAALKDPLRFSDDVTAQLSRQACERETMRLGLGGHAATARDHLIAPDGHVRSLLEVARSLGVSTRTLHRMLGDEGINFTQFVQQAKLEKAQRLLAAGQSTEDVALALGYADERSFRRGFERGCGETPAAFRSRNTA